MIMVASVVFGQFATKEMQLRRDLPSFESAQKTNITNMTKSAIWTDDFSNPANWIIGTDSPDEAHWVVCTYATAPAGWLPVYKMTDVFASETVDNGFALLNSDVQGDEGTPFQDAWIQLANPIDLSAVSSPRFIFTSYYRKWADVVYLDYSIDGGTTWASKELFTEIVQGGITTVDRINFVNIPEVGNQASVLIRFRFSGDWDYGCFIDDVSVVNAPPYDLQLLETATNFFQVYDYTSDGNGYHYSSHIGNVPYKVLTDTAAYLVFNAIVKNNGTSNATPVVNVTINDPNSLEVYNFDFTSDIELTPDAIDTLDIAWFVGEEFHVTPESWVFGKYDIHFNLSILDQEDGAMDNNSYSTYFNATENVYGKDGGNLDGITGPGLWLGHGLDGDMFAVNYLLYETTRIDSVQAFIVATSDINTSVIAHIMVYDSGLADWNDLATSTIVTIEESMLGSWLTFTFADPAIVSSSTGEGSFEFRVALEFYYGGVGNELWIGEDNTVPSSLYSTCWKFAGDDWGYISNYYTACPMLRACLPALNFSSEIEVASNINVYPNPSTGIINVTNAEGASIEVLNIMGQVVASVNNASQISNIDLSNNANGTYFVRIVKGNEVHTAKINIVK